MPQAARRITQADIEANFERIQRAHEETERALREFAEENRSFKASTEALKESIIETRKTLNESIEKASKASNESLEEARKTLFKAIGGIGDTIGKMSESMLVPSLVEKFRQLGFTFDSASRNKKIYIGKHEVYTEIDAFLENSTQAMAVEVKTTLRLIEVEWHVERMEKIRHYADSRDDKRQFYGAMAANVISDEIRRYAFKQGFYLIEPSGEDIMIATPVTVKIW